jgi:hypothetical protein
VYPPVPPLAVIVTGVIGTPCIAVINTHSPEITFTVTEQVAVPALPALSFIVTVYVKDPDTVGVPEIVPAEEIVSPAGSPVAENVYGPPTPPLPVIVTGVIGTFCTALMTAHVPDTGGFTVTEQVIVPVFPALSFIVTV